MGNQVTTQPTSAEAPRAASAEQDRVRTIYRSRLEVSTGGDISISSQLAPTSTDLKIIRDRRRELLNATEPGAKDRMAIFVLQLFDGYSAKTEKGQLKNTVAAYVAQLAHLPLWAVEQGCIKAAARDEAFAPSAGQLRAICEDIVQPTRDELADLRRVIDAKVYHVPAPGERERIKAGFNQLLADLKKTNSAFAPKPKSDPYRFVGRTDAEIQAILKAERLPQMSDQAGKRFAPPPADASPEA